MRSPRGGSLAWSVVPFAVAGGLALLAYLHDASSIDMLGAIARAPHASIASPAAGPAIYRGRVFGPSDRRSQLGGDVAAAWWRVDRRSGKSRSMVCSGSEQDGLRLETDGVSLPLAFIDASTTPFVIGATDENHWERRIVVDLGLVAELSSTQVPTEYAVCRRGERFRERRLAQGASVEVLACHANGALRACPGPVGAVIAVGTLRDHRQHRADDLQGDLRVTLALTLGALVFLSVQTLAFVSRVGRVLSSRTGRAR